MTGQAGQGKKPRPGHRKVAQWTRDYERLPGIPDEFIAQDGTPREVWTRFFEAFGAMAPVEIERRFGSADRHLREAGVTYRAPGEIADRIWPLSHVPLLIDESEWLQISAAMTQRAELLEKILGDLYGDASLVASGAIPAAAIAGSSEYLRAMRGVKPPGGRYLNVYAADLGRGPDGRWWVLGDRTQAPSGMGYALENRLVLSRAFTDLYKSMNVERVAPFFEAFRDSLRASADRDEPRVGLLSPGPFSETYFEHATLARYLGFLLVEGDDLAVSGDRVHIRTVAGLKRLDVLLRRVDANSLDPLELDASSQLGVPGLIDVVRKNGVVVANMPGSGVMEARALLGFLPSLSRKLLGEPLKMPHIATWWCGQKSAREEVLARLDDFAIEGAYGGAVPGFPGYSPVLPSQLSPSERAASVRAARLRGGDAGRLDHYARWLLPYCGSTRCPSSLHGRRRARSRRLGRGRQGRCCIDATASRRQCAYPPHRRLGAEPRRRQSVLARALSRARRIHTASDPRAQRAAARSRQRRRHRAAIDRAHPAHADDLGRDIAHLALPAGQDRGSGIAGRGAVWLSAIAGALCIADRHFAARAAVARRLAGHHRNGRAACA
jgi:uncharacterized circularly permuted ATP-grasp superfamily protein